MLLMFFYVGFFFVCLFLFVVFLRYMASDIW